jgi:hypothetical protein
MPIVGHGKDVHVEYSIPEAIDKRIPEHFYIAMAGELCSIFGPQIFEKIEWYDYDEEGNEIPNSRNEEFDYYDLDSSTGGWYEAFKETCIKLNLRWLVDYHSTLEWYDSDIFDGIIEARIIKNFLEKENSPANSYYKYLIKKNQIPKYSCELGFANPYE